MSGTLPRDRWQRVNELFDSASSLLPEERETFLTAACAGDEVLRAEVASLFEFDDRDAFEGSIRSAIDGAARELGNGKALERIGPYRLQREIGSGGMGTVYLAEREDDFNQHVAIKIVRGALGSDALRRFRAERQILAKLRHPNIASLLDGGTTPSGLPFLVMEYVEGVPINGYCEAHALGTRQRLELFCRVCDGVSHAHRSFVVHRDLKPSNILVTADGTPKLLDFGIAKLLDDSTAAADATSSMSLLTPEYASPEQVRAEPITTASDVYSAGVLLFELLTGQRPHRITTRRPQDIEEVVCRQESPRPSAVVTSRRLARELAGDLDTIVRTALQKEPARRYWSIEHLSDDVRRFLTGRPIVARPSTWHYRARRFVKRHRAGVATAVVFAIVVSVLGTGLVLYAARSVRERNAAQRATTLLIDLFGNTAQRGPAATMTLPELLARATERVQRELQDQPETRAPLLDAIGTIYLDLGLSNQANGVLSASMDARRKTSASDSLDAARTMSLNADALRARGQLADAEQMARHAVNMAVRLVGSRSQQAAQLTNSLALVLEAEGRRNEAEALFVEVTNTARAVLGPESPMVAEGLANTARVLQAKGEFSRAEEIAREALAIRRRAFTRMTADSMKQLAGILKAAGKTEEADEILAMPFARGDEVNARQFLEMLRANGRLGGPPPGRGP